MWADDARRIPHAASTSEPYYHGTDSHPPMADVQLIGLTGWNYADQLTVFVTIDLDSVSNHAGGLPNDQLAAIRGHLEAIPAVELIRSKSGHGLHARIYADPADMPRSSSHTHHAARAKAIVAWLSAQTGTDLLPYIDCYGGNAWIYAAQTGLDGFALVKPREGYPPRDAWDTIALPSNAPLSNAALGKRQAELADYMRRTGLGELTGGILRTHTAALARAHADLHYAGPYTTRATGKGLPADRNCYLAPQDDDTWLAVRYGKATDVAPWFASAKGDTCCLFGLPEASPVSTRFKVLSSRELDTSRYVTEYMVDRTLVRGQPCIVAGPKKALKTTVLIDLAISLASGTPFLGRLAVPQPRNVLVMSGESGLATIQETARRIGNARGLRLGQLDRLRWCETLPKFGEADQLDALREILPGTDVLIIDPAYLAMPAADNGNLFAQGVLLASMTDLCRELGVTLVLAHHTRKGGKADPHAAPELEDIAWAGFQEWARQWLLIGRRDRYVPGTGEHALWLHVGGSAGHSDLWALDVSEGVYDPDTPRRWQVTLSTPDDARESEKQQNLDDARARILDTLRQYPDGETIRTIRDTSGVGAKTAKLLLMLANSGLITTCRVTKSKQTYDGYRLAV